MRNMRATGALVSLYGTPAQMITNEALHALLLDHHGLNLAFADRWIVRQQRTVEIIAGPSGLLAYLEVALHTAAHSGYAIHSQVAVMGDAVRRVFRAFVVLRS